MRTAGKYTIAVSLVIVLSAATWARSGIYRTPLLLWQETVRRSPNKARPHTNLGFVLKELGNRDGALAQFEAAYELQPDNPNVLNNLATLYSAQGRKEEARKLLQRAVEYEPLHKDARYNLALLSYQLGRVQEAEREYRFIVQTWPDSPEAGFGRLMLVMIEDRRPR